MVKRCVLDGGDGEGSNGCVKVSAQVFKGWELLKLGWRSSMGDATAWCRGAATGCSMQMRRAASLVQGEGQRSEPAACWDSLSSI
ncbi:hypothetical protein V6N13_142228 [Hibiscus sabdariffa]